MKQKLLLLWIALLGLNMSLRAQNGNEFAGGDGTAQTPYLISTPQQLAALNNYLGDSYSDTYYKLTNDIDLTSWLSQDRGNEEDTKGWWPIGSYDEELLTDGYFYGHFDGAGHTVSGLWISRDDKTEVGLFGHFQKGSLSNLTVEIPEGKKVHARNYVGGLVGISYVPLTHCHVRGEGEVDVKTNVGYANVGGLAGWSQNQVSYCSASVNVTVTARRVGGLIGYQSGGTGYLDPNVQAPNIIYRSYATGDVTARGEVGGLVGFSSGCSIEQCYATGAVSVTEENVYSRIGGLVGSMSGEDIFISECYATGTITGNMRGGLVGEIDRDSHLELVHSFYLKGIADGAYFKLLDATSTINNTGSGAKTETELKSASTYASWSNFSSNWYFSTISGFPVFRDHSFTQGEGTIDSPWQISTPQQLAELNYYLGESFRESYFILTGDIDLTDYLTEGNAGYNEGKGWIPIGNSENSFEGFLDGQGFSVSGLWIDREEEEAIGLFGSLRGATLKNIHVTVADAGVKGTMYVGGLSGQVLAFETSPEMRIPTTLTHCSVSGGTISGKACVGGVTGWFTRSQMLGCFASVDIEVLKYTGESYLIAPIGGLAGGVNHSSLTDCYATGDISLVENSEDYTHQTLQIGGLAGNSSNAKITRCYAAGEVPASVPVIPSFFTGTAGLIGNNNNNNNTITSSYFNTDAHEEGVGNGDADGVTGVSVADLRKQLTFEGWSFDGDDALWRIKEGESAPYFHWLTGNYPLYEASSGNGPDDPDDPENPENPEDPNEPDTSYHTIRLIVDEGIGCNYSTGILTVSQDDHLFLTFYAEDNEQTLEDLLLRIDGVETAFKVSADGRSGSYILSPISRDQTIQIILRESSPADPDPDNTTGNAAIAESKVSILIENGELIIDNAGQAVDVAVYGITGKNVASLRRVCGSRSIALPSGIYIVRVGQTTMKVIVP